MSEILIPKDYPRIYGFVNGMDPGNGLLLGTVVCQDGTTLGSELAFGEKPLAYRFTHKKWVAKYREHYPNGYTFEWVHPEDVRHHAGLCDAIEKAQLLAHEPPIQ